VTRPLTTALLIAGILASCFSPAVFAQGQAPSGVSLGQPSANGTSIDLMLAIWIGGALIGGVVTALTFIFRLFLRSRDSTESALSTRIAALETALAEERKESAGINSRMLDLLQGVVRDNGNAMAEHTKAIAEQSKVLSELVGAIEENRKYSTEEHTRVLGAVGSIVAAYDRRSGPA
jgi:hypothetical protein